jgi:uncharacterized protein YrrD
MRKIPELPNARYYFDFKFMPYAILGPNGTKLVFDIIDSKIDFIIDAMNTIYFKMAAKEGIDIGEGPIFNKGDFSLTIYVPKEIEYLYLILNMPDEEIDSIIADKHIITIRKEDFNIRHFTAEKSSTSSMMQLKELYTKTGVPLERLDDIYLCELLKMGRKNYGIYHNRLEDIVKKITEILLSEDNINTKDIKENDD